MYCIIVKCPHCEGLNKRTTGGASYCDLCGNRIYLSASTHKYNGCPKKIICDALCEVCDYFEIGETVYDQRSLLYLKETTEIRSMTLTHVERGRVIFFNHGERYAFNLIKTPILLSDENDIDFYKKKS